MLVLTRYVGELVVLQLPDDSEIEIELLDISGSDVRFAQLGFSGPRGILVDHGRIEEETENELVFSYKQGDKLHIRDDDLRIEVKITLVDSNQARLGFRAPQSVKIMRYELLT